MDISNKGVKINLPYVSLRSAMIHVVDVGNVQLPVSLKNAEKLLQKAKPTVSGCGFHRKEDIFRNLSWQIDRTRHFGTIILQIPVENGHEGGELQVESQMIRNSPLETLTLDLSSGSDQSFYVNFLNVNCVHEMKPLTRGWRIELAYNILWKPEVATLVLPNISSFLVTLVSASIF
ncbi:hypothetical protein DAPPUDRAFT_256738 [Daphnia pulex]|uniref:Uncharacterized protein n=1 Tax=Daphnia pulex TaxID=6669 RepID=E9HBZ6_DAPPU|nr:hypothetical protein DAPPUDRAFT_256738 [Daphnia pulex]|eukprot:EFX70676.1 hypothetical protein DAPPUDRAFT_256738 [Daphnia pulex]